MNASILTYDEDGYPILPRNANYGRHWVNNGVEERLVSESSVYYSKIQTGEYKLGRLSSHRPPIKVKGCRRYHEPKVFTYRKLDGSTFQVPEETFHKKKGYFKLKGYVLCRKSPYAVLDDPEVTLTENERDFLNKKRESYYQNKRISGMSYRWLSSSNDTKRVHINEYVSILEDPNNRYIPGRRQPQLDGSFNSSFRRRKNSTRLFI